MNEISNGHRDPEKDNSPTPLTAGRWSAVGIQIGVSVALGAFGGMWLDDRFGTDPLFVLLGIFLGLTAVFIDIYRLMKKTQNGS